MDKKFSITIEAAVMNALQNKKVSIALNHGLNGKLYNAFNKQGLQTTSPLVLYEQTGIITEMHIGAGQWLRIDNHSYDALQKKAPLTSFATFTEENSTTQKNPLTYDQKNLFTVIVEEYYAIISAHIREYDAKNT